VENNYRNYQNYRSKEHGMKFIEVWQDENNKRAYIRLDLIERIVEDKNSTLAHVWVTGLDTLFQTVETYEEIQQKMEQLWERP
jgi:hypothetical protein